MMPLCDNLPKAGIMRAFFVWLVCYYRDAEGAFTFPGTRKGNHIRHDQSNYINDIEDNGRRMLGGNSRFLRGRWQTG